MNTSDLFAELKRVVARPEPFSAYTADLLWADPHTSEKMLQFHLNPEIDVSSRRLSVVEESVEWMAERFGLRAGKRVIDFGCGPGLYASRFAAYGADVTGIDFSPASIRYARERASEDGQNISFQQANYLEFEPRGEFDLICMIMCDLCALSPNQRSAMLAKFSRLLASKGRIVLDVYSLEAFRQKQETVAFEENLLNGFWSPSPYFGFLASFKYEAECASLDKYTIVGEHTRREVFNWLQYFSPESLERALSEHGLALEAVLGDLAGHAYDPQSSEFAVVVKMA